MPGPIPEDRGGGRLVILPAIDLRGGKCVRLVQGDYARETVFGDDPAFMARSWVDQGAEGLHLVDLDGAREGRPVNGKAIEAVVRAAGVPCQLGGGLRQEADLRRALDLGVERLVIGTQALRRPDWFAEMSARFPGRLLLGIDAREGFAAAQGWTQLTGQRAVELARQYSGWSLAGLIYTDISRDGMLGGPNLAAMEEMARSVSLPVYASGGVTTLDDVRRLARLPLAGCVVGRALYEGALDLRQAMAAAREPIRETKPD